MIIDVQGLKEIINIVLEKYLNIETEEDSYWYISSDERFEFTQSPESGEICVGSLEDNYSSLVELLNKQREVNILDLERISSILNIISYETECSNENWL